MFIIQNISLGKTAKRQVSQVLHLHLQIYCMENSSYKNFINANVIVKVKACTTVLYIY